MFKFVTLAVGAATAAATQKYSIDAATRTYRDEYGRARIFHGQNVVIKLPDYLPIQDHFDYDMSLVEEDYQYLKDWGTKIIRLGVMWESVETEKGVYDYDYLKNLDPIIKKFGDYGMAVIVDNHQDAFARQFCGEGVPPFYTPTDVATSCPWTPVGIAFSVAGHCKSIASYNYETDENGYPLISECIKASFTDYYTSPEVADAFAALYDNKNGMLDALAAYWKVTAEYFSNNPDVIGYDIINEPYPANFYKEETLLFDTGKFDRTKLFPLHQQCTESIRQVDDNKIIFFEAAQMPDTMPIGGGIFSPVGFETTPGGDDYLNRQSLNDHTYCCQMSATVCANGEPSLDQKDKCKSFHQRKVEQRSKDAERLQVPLIFSEFGACFDGQECATEIRNSADAFDEHLASWAYWQYKSFKDFTTTGGPKEGMFNPDGSAQSLKLAEITRTYGHAYQGTPKTSVYSNDDHSYITSFTLDTSITEGSEVYMNKQLFYPDYDVTISETNGGVVSATVTSDPNENYLMFKISDSSYNGKDITFHLTKKLSDSEAQQAFAFGDYPTTYTVTKSTAESAKCKVTAKFGEEVESNIMVDILDRKGDLLQEFKDVKSGNKTFNCTDLIDATAEVWAHTTSIFSKSELLGTINMASLNGHDVEININKAASFFTQ